MEKVGILVVSYGGRGAAIIDSFHRSLNYKTEIYVVDKQKNPFNVKKATEHVVVPDLNLDSTVKFASRRRNKIDFGIVGPEKPIIEGLRDVMEKKTRIPMVCPTKRCAIEASKVAQRRLFEKAMPAVNPKFKVFNPSEIKSISRAEKTLIAWLDELDNQAVVKPDVPAAGKGVGVWGDHFSTRKQLLQHFLANYEHGPVIVEEKIEGEESSYQAFCDGKNLVSLPDTRDYKRAFDGDKGPNTGGMGSYKAKGSILPFITVEDQQKEVEIVNRVFSQMKKHVDRDELRGIPFYTAFMHTAKGPKILENNSRPGDPELINILPLLKDDFVDVCSKMIEGNLLKIATKKEASVVTYKAPPSYGGYNEEFPNKVVREETGKPVELIEAHKLTKKFDNNVRIYPASMELKEGKTYSLSSRAVAAVGIGSDIEEARVLSLTGINAIEGGALWNRTDVASRQHIHNSKMHMERLRRDAA